MLLFLITEDSTPAGALKEGSYNMFSFPVYLVTKKR